MIKKVSLMIYETFSPYVKKTEAILKEHVIPESPMGKLFFILCTIGTIWPLFFEGEEHTIEEKLKNTSNDTVQSLRNQDSSLLVCAIILLIVFIILDICLICLVKKRQKSKKQEEHAQKTAPEPDSY